MPRSKCEITNKPGLGVMFSARDKDGDSFEFRKFEGRQDAVVLCRDAGGNLIAAELAPQSLRLFVAFLQEHVAPTLESSNG